VVSSCEPGLRRPASPARFQLGGRRLSSSPSRRMEIGGHAASALEGDLDRVRMPVDEYVAHALIQSSASW
jgi:hypothetical protein